MYIPAKDIEAFTKTNKDNTLNVRGQDIRELDAALEKSLKDGDGKKEEKKGVSLVAVVPYSNVCS